MSQGARAAGRRRWDDEAVARRIARIHADLRRVDRSSLFSALDDAGRSLEILGHSIADDELALRLTEPRALAASYVSASAHLTEAGVASDRREQVLEHGRARVVAALAAVEFRLSSRHEALTPEGAGSHTSRG